MKELSSLAGRKIVFVCGEDEYQSHHTLADLAREVSERYEAVTTVVTAPDPADPTRLPGLEALETADLAIFYIRFRQLSVQELEPIKRYLEAGKPVIGLRTSTHAFQYEPGHPLEAWNEKFGVEVLGAPWISHFGHSSSTDVSVAWGEEAHEILQGIPRQFQVRSWLYQVLPYPQEGANVLLNGYTLNAEPHTLQDDPPRIHPVAWTRTHYGGGRVFTTTMGHPEDFELPAFRQLLLNGMAWALKEEQDEYD